MSCLFSFKYCLINPTSQSPTTVGTENIEQIYNNLSSSKPEGISILTNIEIENAFPVDFDKTSTAGLRNEILHYRERLEFVLDGIPKIKYILIS